MKQSADPNVRAWRIEIRPNAAIQRILLLLGVIFGCAGQFALLKAALQHSSEGWMQALAGGLFVSGAALFGASTRRFSTPLPRLEFPENPAVSDSLIWRKAWSVSWLAAAIVSAALGIRIFARDGESSSVLFLWLLGIVSLLAAQLQTVRIGWPHIVHEERPYLAALAGLLVLALITRVYRLTTLPYNVDGDFAAVGLQARALATGQQHHIFAYGWATVPMLGYLPPWLTMKLFGDGLAGLNASGVVEGLLIIIGVYLLGRDLFHARVGLLAAALMTISYAHLAASRQSSYIDPVVFMVYAVYFLCVGLREGRGWAMVTSGILTALCLEMYYSGRLVIFVAAFVFLFLLLFQSNWLKARWRLIPLWPLAVLVTLGPMLVVFSQTPGELVSHTQTVLILNPDNIKHMEGVFQVNTLPAMLLQQARHTALMFNYYPDTGTQFAIRRPFLDPFTGVLFVLGIGYAVFRWRRFGMALVLAWTALGVVLGCLLTINPPFWARLIILIPPTMLLAALALSELYEEARGALERAGNGRIRGAAPLAMAVLILGVGVLNWNVYLEFKGTYATPRTSIGRYLAAEPASVPAYLISTEFTVHDREFVFLAPGRLAANLAPEQIEGNIDQGSGPMLLILTREQSALVQRLTNSFPQASLETHIGNSPDEVAFYALRIP